MNRKNATFFSTTSFNNIPLVSKCGRKPILSEKQKILHRENERKVEEKCFAEDVKNKGCIVMYQ